MSSCFLCRFNTHKDAVDMHQFIEENIGLMHLDTLSNEVHLELMNRCQGSSMMNEFVDGMHPVVVREHISSHTLNPVIRMGIMLRGLLDLDNKMKNDLHKLDAQGQSLGLDPKMIEAYLRLQTQVVNLYKCDPNRMMFKNPTGQPQ
jgi:hypothetical protein